MSTVEPPASNVDVVSAMAALHPTIVAELRQKQQDLITEGLPLKRQQLQPFYDTFRRRFGPEVLRRLRGLELLELMHAHGSKDSLVYWLEFKADEEFPDIFGSIAGGSALKFGVYKRKESGTWARKGQGPAPVDITAEEAIEIAEKHREQLLAAVEVIEVSRPEPRDEDYRQLQQKLEEVAPDVYDTAWGHKYLSLTFPEILDDFHAEDWQRWQLVRCLQLPPRDNGAALKGRYVCAGRFVALARELNEPLKAACLLINRRHGGPRQYWRIGTTDDPKVRRKYWQLMRDGGFVAIGWPHVGDLSDYATGTRTKDELVATLQAKYPNTPQATGRAANEILKFVRKAQQGDRVLTADGMKVLGVGEISGAYRFSEQDAFPHQRDVHWFSNREWTAVDAFGLQTAVAAINDHRNQVEAERRILEDADSVVVSVPPIVKPKGPPGGEGGTRAILPRLSAVQGEIQAVLERKGQVILYGPPGTGKTHWAIRTARELAALRAFGKPFEALSNDERAHVAGNAPGIAPLVRTCTFHPEYGYEDFIEGYRPKSNPDGQLGFSLEHGIFRHLCADAEKDPSQDFFLIVDEINRGDIPRIFGELLTLLEKDKRGQAVILPVSGDAFRVPSNVHVIATMNTADRSIALLDIALRRRFGFVELMPDYNVLGETMVGDLPLKAWLADLNQRIRSAGGGDARNRQVGHSFLLEKGKPITTPEQFVAALRHDIVPLLEEYCYDDFGMLSTMLGEKLVDEGNQRVRRELFDAARMSELVSALMRPEIATAAAAILASSHAPEVEEPEEEPDDSDDRSEVDELSEGESASEPVRVAGTQ